MSSSTACDIGTSAAPHSPCSSRASTIWGSDCAIPHSADAMVKPTIEIRNTDLRPKRLASHPLNGVITAAAMM